MTKSAGCIALIYIGVESEGGAQAPNLGPQPRGVAHAAAVRRRARAYADKRGERERKWPSLPKRKADLPVRQALAPITRQSERNTEDKHY
jgi:hypothetical protein